jgi:hypothetical protein
MTNASAAGLLEALQEWYCSQCDGDWEHEFGMTIETLDNPGWEVSIALAETPLEGRAFTPVKRPQGGEDWISCRVEGSTFRGSGGALNLAEIIRIFLDWMRAETLKS